jgi:hypothetical protein
MTQVLTGQNNEPTCVLNGNCIIAKIELRVALAVDRGQNRKIAFLFVCFSIFKLKPILQNSGWKGGRQEEESCS